MSHQNDTTVKLPYLPTAISAFLICTFVVLIFKNCSYHQHDENAASAYADPNAHGGHSEHGEAKETKGEEPKEATAASKETVKVSLANGSVVLNGFKGGIEDKLVAFLSDSTTKGGKDVWFDFDNLNFKTGSADITPESDEQISNIAAILKAFPKTKIKIGGYTDKTGDATVNKELSQKRADAVLAALKAKGANAAQLEGAEGYGAEFAKAAADAPDAEKQKDRRISVGVREK